MARQRPIEIFSHWHKMLEGLPLSSQGFYESLEHSLTARQVPNIRVARSFKKEGGLLSAKREYLEVRRGSEIFYVCGAPFGNGFFVSWWLGEMLGFFAMIRLWLSLIPVVGPYLAFRKSFYQVDVALMFQSLTHSAVLEVIDSLIESKGLKALTEGERKPILRDFFAQNAVH